MYNRHKHLHFVGIGGVGMAGIAEILLNLGYVVSGSDVARNSLIEHLEELGAKISVGHRAEHLAPDTSVLIISSAISSDNPEVLRAHERNIPVIPRAEMLAELMRMKYGVAVAGSHGKTTTTSIVAKIITDASLDPTVIIGGRVLTKRTGAELGKGDYLVAEADESDGSFALLRPAISIVTNIDSEHMEHYGSFGALEDAFHGFMSKVPFYGVAIACFDDPVVARLAETLKRRVVSYGLAPAKPERLKNSLQCALDVSASDIVIDGGNSNFTLQVRGETFRRVSLPLPGVHMVQNALAAVAVGIELGIDVEMICVSLEGFPGVARRSEVVWDEREMVIIDDYAHHPTEIKTTLAAIRSGRLRKLARENLDVPSGRLIVIFQPHRFSRTRELFSEFINAFGDADELIVGDIYAAGEDEINGITGQKLALAIQHPKVTFVSDLNEIVAPLKDKLKAGDVVATIGAGNVSLVAHKLACALK